MRLIKQNIERDGTGTVVLLPEEPEDMVRSLPTTPHLLRPVSLPLCTGTKKKERS
jgi:hypothetical protein